MKKNISHVESGAGFIGSLASKLIKGLRGKGVSDEDTYEITREGEVADVMIDKIVDVLVDFINQAKNIFQIINGQHKTTEKAVAAGKYDWASNSINNKIFPYRSRPKGKRKIVLLEFDYDYSSAEQVLTEAKKQGLERPDYEDALDFGEQHPDVQRKRRVVFLHEPWQAPDDIHYVIVLSSSSSGRRLSLHFFDRGWGRGDLFAFVRK